MLWETSFQIINESYLLADLIKQICRSKEVAVRKRQNLRSKSFFAFLSDSPISWDNAAGFGIYSANQSPF
jgi:hypothetical protein